MSFFSLFIFVLVAIFMASRCHSLSFSSKLVHRFSDEARNVAASRGARNWPKWRTSEYYSMLARGDVGRIRRRLGARFQMVYPSEGSDVFEFGNDFGWLHYTWIDIGTPNVSFLVALDAGSDLLWVPCDCVQCAPLSGYHITLDKDLGMYSPAESRTSRHLSCSHELCSFGSSCNSPKQPCPYNITYYTEDTSSSGLLVEDILYLTSAANHATIQASVIIGCGKRQSGGYLDGIAPDGLLGLGFGNVSIPSILARKGLVRNSFSMCFQNDDSGRIFFGDQGLPDQQHTPFVPWDGKYKTYIVEADSFCIGSHCLEKTKFKALVDSGSSFTFLPDDVYKKVTSEFDRQVNASRLQTTTDVPWEYCYESSTLAIPEVPTITIVFAGNMSFVATNPLNLIYSDEGQAVGFCLAVQLSPETLGTFGQNFMTGYHMVFDREKLHLGWSRSDCQSSDDSMSLPLTPPPYKRPENPLPTDEQQRTPNGGAVSPAVAGRAPTTNSSVSVLFNVWYSLLFLMTYFAAIHIR